MSEIVIATGITAKCADGSVHTDVMMKVVDSVVIYETANGEHLCGDCCVKFIDGATFLAPLPYVTRAIEQYRKQEA
jgi:hypothetical protein